MHGFLLCGAAHRLRWGRMSAALIMAMWGQEPAGAPQEQRPVVGSQ
jgi:hypothetical protein